jgi:FlaG/FlaF family flagellin (archaellin)
MMPPPQKKGKGLLIAIISIVVVVVIVGGVVAALALSSNKSNTSTTSTATTTPSASPTTAATPTSSVPAGFKQFSNSQYSIAYPGDWTAKASSSGSGEQFTGPTAQVFQVDITPNTPAGQEGTFNAAFCQVLNSKGKPTPTTTTIGGQTWQQLDCQDDGSLHAVVESVVYKGALYSLAYLSLSPTFTSDKTQFFTPMEQSFTFLT